MGRQTQNPEGDGNCPGVCDHNTNCGRRATAETSEIQAPRRPQRRQTQTPRGDGASDAVRRSRRRAQNPERGPETGSRRTEFASIRSRQTQTPRGTETITPDQIGIGVGQVVRPKTRGDEAYERELVHSPQGRRSPKTEGRKRPWMAGVVRASVVRPSEGTKPTMANGNRRGSNRSGSSAQNPEGTETITPHCCRRSVLTSDPAEGRKPDGWSFPAIR